MFEYIGFRAMKGWAVRWRLAASALALTGLTLAAPAGAQAESNAGPASPAVATPATPPAAAHNPAAEKPAGVAAVSCTVSGVGLDHVLLNGREVASGGWRLFDSQEYFHARHDQLTLGPITGKSFTQTGDNTYTVVHTYADVRVTYQYIFRGEDTIITADVFNHSKTGKSLHGLAFRGLRLAFGQEPDSPRLAHFSPDYVQAYGWGLAHPSTANQLGAWYARSAAFNMGLIPLQAGMMRKMFLYYYRANGPKVKELIYLLDQDIAAGQTGTCAIEFRFSANPDWHHLLGPYKDDYQRMFPPVQYRGDARPLAMVVDSKPEWITPRNPYGFATPQMRFDLDQGTTAGVMAFVTHVAPLVQGLDGQGYMFWDLQGWNPRGAMYRPDFDNFPAPIKANLPKLIMGLRSKGLTAGLLARPAEVVIPTSPTQDGTRRISPDNPAQMDAMWARFNWAIDTGFSCFYLDTFGQNLDDVKIMRQLRARMVKKGVNIPTYSEYGLDVMLPYSGFYIVVDTNGRTGQLEFAGNNQFLSPELLRIFQWLEPGTAVIAHNMALKTPVDQVWQWCYKQDVLPLVGSTEFSKAAILRPLMDQYINPFTRWWRDTPPPPTPAAASGAAPRG